MGRDEVSREEDRRTDFVGKTFVDVHLRALRIDQDTAGAVFEKERNKEGFVEDRFPLVAFAGVALDPLPCR